AAERLRVDARVAGIGSEKNLGFVNDLALGHDVAVVQALEHEAGKDDVRGGGADVDADAGEADLVLDLEAAPDVAEEDPAARFPAHAGARLLRHRRDVSARVYAVRHAALLQRFPVFPAAVRVLLSVGGGAS